MGKTLKVENPLTQGGFTYYSIGLGDIKSEKNTWAVMKLGEPVHKEPEYVPQYTVSKVFWNDDGTTYEVNSHAHLCFDDIFFEWTSMRNWDAGGHIAVNVYHIAKENGNELTIVVQRSLDVYLIGDDGKTIDKL